MPVILYERQRQILDYVSQYIQRNSYAPSLKEVAQAMQLKSLATIHEHLDQLMQKGVIRISGRGKTRKIEIVDQKLVEPDKGVRLPILGYFCEGRVIEPYSKTDTFYYVLPTMISSKNRAFILEVNDDVLLEEGIIKGDMVVLEEAAMVNDGETIIALLLENKAVFKKFYKEATRVRLEWCKAKKAPLYINTVQIQGRVIAVIRKY